MIEQNIMFSVIIPLYNKASYIQLAVESVLKQTYVDFELIIVNDGSSDDSLNVVQSFRDSRLRIISQKNQGVSASRNNGVLMAQHEYIAFLDGDDWWDPTFLEKMAVLIVSHPAAGIYGCQYFWVKNGKQKCSINHEPSGFAGYFDYFVGYMYAWWMPLTSISVVIRKSVFEEMRGFKTNLKFGEDFDLWVRIALAYPVAYLNEPLAFYNQDVIPADRALGGKRWRLQEHFLFNLEFLREAEQTNPILKRLLDGLKVRGLLKFYLRNDYSPEVAAILEQVDFSKQPRYYQRIYTWPKSLIKLYFRGKKVGSNAKQSLRKSLKSP
ncbi:glycosyltransferase family 2 protein [Spirosoma panaciterrae]|uniref:glycosyltransferase family 2 protein n=1 Tax=Spirosoma panaciterrae TaxID=496058 RepID=UPI000367C5C0|nr:glycosyltransferase [Spirosoma panaciterrae]